MLTKKWALLHAVVEGGDGGGGVVDRGDDLVPPVDKAAGEAAAAADPAQVENQEPAKETEQPRGEDGRFIPKAVFDNRLRGEREAREAAERRAAELEIQLGKVTHTEETSKLEEQISNLEALHAQQLLDGKKDEAAKTMRDIRMTERRIALQENDRMSIQQREQTKEEIRLDLAIDRLEGQYDMMNPQSENYNQEAVDDVLGWQRVYMSRDRLPPSQALMRAADKVMGMYSKSAPPAEKKSDDTGLNAAHDTPRKESQLKKNLDADKAQPPSLSSVGHDSDKAGVKDTLDMSKLSAEEYDALPEATKAKLRGDF